LCRVTAPDSIVDKTANGKMANKAETDRCGSNSDTIRAPSLVNTESSYHQIDALACRE